MWEKESERVRSKSRRRWPVGKSEQARKAPDTTLSYELSQSQRNTDDTWTTHTCRPICNQRAHTTVAPNLHTHANLRACLRGDRYTGGRPTVEALRMHTERRHCGCLAHVRMWGRVADGLLLNIPLLSEVSPPAVPRTNVDAYSCEALR